MKVDLSKLEMKQLQEALDANPVRRWMQTKDTMKFEVGDVLIKMLKRHDYQTKAYTWQAENINSDTKMAQRYVYVFEDEFGIGYFKQLKVSTGTLGKELFCTTDFDFHCTRFDVDPEYAELQFLDADFDIKQIHKKSLEAQKIVTKMNRKIGFKPKSLTEINEFFDKLNVGDKFWTSSDFTGKYYRELVLLSKGKQPIATAQRNNDWSYRQWVSKQGGPQPGEHDLHKISYKEGTWTEPEHWVYTYLSNVLFTQQPAKVEKK